MSDVKVYELINILSTKLGEAEVELDGSISIDGEVVAGEPKEMEGDDDPE